METRIKELRLEKKMTQSGLAMEIGCSQNLISKIELGKAEPTSDVLISLARKFGVSVDYLLCETEYKLKADLYVQKDENPSSMNRLYEYYSRYRQLSSENQRMIDKMIQFLLRGQND